jgi:hypothetical protein
MFEKGKVSERGLRPLSLRTPAFRKIRIQNPSQSLFPKGRDTTLTDILRQDRMMGG